MHRFTVSACFAYVDHRTVSH